MSKMIFFISKSDVFLSMVLAYAFSASPYYIRTGSCPLNLEFCISMLLMFLGFLVLNIGSRAFLYGYFSLAGAERNNHCKLYLAGGVVAAFECKITLRRNHIQKLMENSKFIRELQIKDYGSIKKDLKSNIFYGLLAHSHEWKRPNSKPKDNIRNSIKEYDKKIIKHPVEMPNVLCVANVSTWHASKLIVPPQPDVKLHHYFLGSGYIEDYAENEIYTPVGAMIFCLLEHLSWEYSSLRSIVRYMQALNIIGGGQGKMRSWPLDILSEETRKNMCKFKNGGLWDEWSMFVR